MVSADYTVKLTEVFQGPMDLLLHLVREQEVEIHEIEINQVIDGYLAYLKDLEQVDIELAGDFVVMAATLMAIKSRSLLPREEVDLEAELDPRDELIQRLIEYRHFKEASRDLSERMQDRAQRFAHGRRPEAGREDEEPTLDFSEVTQWDLLSHFSRLMRETLSNRSMRIHSDDRPLRWHVERLVGWIKEKKHVSLRALVEESVESGEASRPALIGTFCALLELIKIGAVRAHQAHARDDIRIAIVEEVEGDLDEFVRMAGFDDERAQLPSDAPAPALAGEPPERTEPGETGRDEAGETEDPPPASEGADGRPTAD